MYTHTYIYVFARSLNSQRRLQDPEETPSKQGDNTHQRQKHTLFLGVSSWLWSLFLGIIG